MAKRSYRHRCFLVPCVIFLIAVLVLGLYFRPRAFCRLSPASAATADPAFSSIYGEIALPEDTVRQIVAVLNDCTVRRAPGTAHIDYRLAVYSEAGDPIAELTFGESSESCSVYIRTDAATLKRFVPSGRSETEAFSELFARLEQARHEDSRTANYPFVN